MINQKRVLNEFYDLVKVRCSTHDEREMADILKQKLQDLGAVSIQEDKAGEELGGNAGNIVANFAGTVPGAKTIMLTAHMDCVEPCANIHPVLKDGVIRSDGTTILGADDKAGVEAILEGLRQMNEQKLPHGPLQVVFTISEEGGVHGSQHIDQSLLHADYGFTFDTGGHPGLMSIAAPGKNQFIIHVKGKASHAGVAPEKGHNAIIAAAKLLADAPQGRLDEETTCNAGIIQGGTATNVVAAECTIRYEARSRNKEKLQKLTQAIIDHFEKGAAKTDCEANVELAPDYDPYAHDKDNPAIQLASRACEKLGFPIKLAESGGGSDANHFNEYGIPTIVMGVGMENGHTLEEYILEKDLYDSCELVVGLIQEAASTAK